MTNGNRLLEVDHWLVEVGCQRLEVGCSLMEVAVSNTVSVIHMATTAVSLRLTHQITIPLDS